MFASPRCKARTRTGTPCRNGAMANGCCRMHGGASPGAPKGNANAHKHGRYGALGREREVRWQRFLAQGRALLAEARQRARAIRALRRKDVLSRE
jgi:uncharacterized protein YjcR